MSFQKGHKKIGGRTKGTGNKVGKETKRIIDEILTGELDSGKLTTELSQLTGKDYIHAISNLARLVVPKTSEVELEDVSGAKIDWSKIPLKKRKEVLALIKTAQNGNQSTDS